jgi:heat shock protein HslJ
VLVVVGALVLGGCGDDGAAGGRALTGRTFLSQTVTGRTLVDGTRITLTFAARELRASAGCNTLFAPYSVRGETLAVDASGMGMTEMGCTPERHAQDDWLATFLQGSPAIELDGTALTLRAGGTVLAFADRRVADPDRPLAGTPWRIDTVIDGDTARSVGSAAAVVVELRTEGTLTATSAGCTSVTAPYTRDGDVLRIGTVTVDTIGCPDPWQPTIDVLRAGTVRFTIVATRLTLTAGRAGVAAVASS